VGHKADIQNQHCPKASWATRGPQVGHGKQGCLPLTIGLFRAKLLFDYWSPPEIFAHVSTDSAVSPLVLRLAGIEPTTLGFGDHAIRPCQKPL
jgi:hypothetical protein